MSQTHHLSYHQHNIAYQQLTGRRNKRKLFTQKYFRFLLYLIRLFKMKHKSGEQKKKSRIYQNDIHLFEFDI